MKFIGFSGKYYTLWDITSEIITTERAKYERVTRTYIKNISYDRDKAIALYPGVTVDETLHGHTTWRSTKCIERYDTDKFRCGKYSGQKIADCTDYEYLHWAYNAGGIIPYESMDLVLSILENAGYCKINEHVIATPEQVAEIENSYVECEDNTKVIDETGSINITFERNLDDEGNIRIGNMDITFENFKVLEYAGYTYGLPTDAKGTAKRIKGKTLKITPSKYEIEVNKYGWGATLKIEVKDFEILK